MNVIVGVILILVGVGIYYLFSNADIDSEHVSKSKFRRLAGSVLALTSIIGGMIVASI